jgi:type IV pilus assembly protein PilE
MLGFSFIEIICTLAIISILASLAYPLYSQQIIHSRRTQAEAQLMALALKLENYFLSYGSYEGASLEMLGINTALQDNYQYELLIIDGEHYQLNATPPPQTDRLCGQLSLSESGEKTSRGAGSIKDCW